MPRNKDLKRIVRTRMQKTGEAYTAARARVISRASSGNHISAANPPAEDYAALAGTRDEAILAKTGRTWEQWVHELDRHNAAEIAHGEIAALVHEKYGVDGWWSQNVTVGYERIKGLRERGQRLDGAYEAAKSKTYRVPVDVLYRAWADAESRRRWLGGIEAAVRTAIEPRSLRLQWPDGTVVAAWFEDKGDSRSTVAIAHQKLPSRTAFEQAKQDWSERLGALGRLLSEEDLSHLASESGANE